MAELYEEQELLVVRDTPSENSNGAGTRARLVRWRVDGHLGRVKFERRPYFTKNGEQRYGAMQGLELEDFQAAKGKWAEVLAIYRTPPAFLATRVTHGEAKA
jgi:hypothetical protein